MSGKNVLLSFHNDPAIKAKYLTRLQVHYEADEIIKGIYWQNGKGCAVGCTIHGSDHAAYETELGIPEWLAYLEDGIFEGMPEEKAKEWPIRFLSSIPVGVDLNKIWNPFAVYLMDSVLPFVEDDEVGKKAITDVKNLHLRVVIQGDEPTPQEWAAARASARASARDAARAAAWDAARASARAAARDAARASARASAWASAWAAARAAARDAARDAAWDAQADEIIRLLSGLEDTIFALEEE